MLGDEHRALLELFSPLGSRPPFFLISLCLFFTPDSSYSERFRLEPRLSASSKAVPISTARTEFKSGTDVTLVWDPTLWLQRGQMASSLSAATSLS